MSRLFSAVALSTIVFLISAAPVPLHADGLYNDYPSWFSPADTGGVVLSLGHVHLQCEYQDVSAAAVRIRGMFNERSSVRLSMLYPVIRRPGSYSHGFSDLLVSSSVRILGDSLNISGLFLRSDFRVPIGSNALRPFSFRSSSGGIYPDIGGGIEVRKKAPLFRVKGSITHTMVGQKEEEGDLTNTHYSLLALFLEFDLAGSLSLQTSVFARKSSGSGYRETYIFSVSKRFSEKLEMILSGGLDSGDDDERIFDSLLSVYFSYSFSAGEKVKAEEGPPPSDRRPPN